MLLDPWQLLPSWTHGNCSHPGSDCNDKAEGHIDTTTYSNMQGGSKYKCSWL
jgi:hypothetical protein